MKVVKTRRLFDAPDAGIKDIDGMPVKQLNALYTKHCSQLMLNFVRNKMDPSFQSQTRPISSRNSWWQSIT